MSKKFLMESAQGMNARIQEEKQIIDHTIRSGQPCPSHRIYGQPAEVFSLTPSGISGEEAWLPSVFLAPALPGFLSLLSCTTSYHVPVSLPPSSTVFHGLNYDAHFYQFSAKAVWSSPNPMTDLPESAIQSNALEGLERHPRVKEIPNPPPFLNSL